MKHRSVWTSLSIGIMLAVGVLLLWGEPSWFPSFYMPDFMGVGALIFAMLILLPEVVFRPRNSQQRKARDHFQLTMALCLVLSGAGELGLWQLYRVGFQYDKLVHIVTPALLTFSFISFISEWWNIEVKRLEVRVALFVLGISIMWEGIEFYSDQIFGTQLFGVYGTQISADTLLDIACNILGIGIALFLLRRQKN